MNLSWVQLGSLVMFFGVALGAFGAHALEGKLSEHYMEVYKTAVTYQFVHGIALFIIAYLSGQYNDPKIQLAGIFFLFGILLFSGSLYILSMSGIKWLGAITPLGGLSFLIGWILIFYAKTS